MTSETRKPINKPKALSALSVGGVSYPFVMLTVSNWIQNSSLADSWLNTAQAHHWLGIAVAAIMGGIAAYRTKDTSEEPTKWQQRKEAKEDARLDAAIARRNGNGEA